MPKEFVLYIDNHALQFITKQEKLNQRHVKWIEYMSIFYFALKNISRQTSKVVDALSIRCLILLECQITILGFDDLKEMYTDDLDFKEIYEACENLVSRDISHWVEYIYRNYYYSKATNYAFQYVL